MAKTRGLAENESCWHPSRKIGCIGASALYLHPLIKLIKYMSLDEDLSLINVMHVESGIVDVASR